MQRLIVYIGLLFLGLNGLEAQDSMNFTDVNRESYRLFIEEKWDSVIIVGKKGLKQDMDFYYLRIRMGIACYNQKKYRQASRHFKQALEFNRADPLAMEYLYYTLLLSGKAEQASILRSEFKGALAMKLPPHKGKAIDRFGVEYLYLGGLNEEILSDPGTIFSGLPAGVQYLTRGYSNASVSLSSSIAPGFRLNQQFTYLSKTNYQYYNDGLNVLLLENQDVRQYQYYISPSIALKSGYTFMPMFHLLSVRYQAPAATGTGGTGYQGGSNSFTLAYLDEMDFVSGLTASKVAGPLDLQLGLWYANLNKRQQVQGRLGFTWYPLGNLNFYAGAYLNSQYEMADSTAVLNLIPELHLGFAIAEKVWLDLNAATGNMANYLEQNGSIVFNSFAEVIRNKAGLTISIPLTEKGSLAYLGGRWTDHQSQFHALDPGSNAITNPIIYNALSIYLGISWKF